MVVVGATVVLVVVVVVSGTVVVVVLVVVVVVSTTVVGTDSAVESLLHEAIAVTARTAATDETSLFTARAYQAPR